MAIGVKKVGRPPELTFGEGLYVLEIVKGMGVTIKHFFRNIFDQKNIPTIEYPEVRRPMPARFRGRHRLMKRESGTPRCVACYCCATACPAKCITIVAGESPEANVEKYPVRFDIDELRCVYCGQCVEGCPCDAIRMDTGWFVTADASREKLILTIETLLEK